MKALPLPLPLPLPKAAMNDVGKAVNKLGDKAANWLFDDMKPKVVVEQRFINTSLLVGKERYIVKADRNLPVSWLVSELIRQYTSRHGIEDPGIVGLRRMGSNAMSSIELHSSIGGAVDAARISPAPSPTSVSTPVLSDITNSSKADTVPLREKQSRRVSDEEPDANWNRWGIDDTIPLVAIVSHPSQEPELVSVSEDANILTLKFGNHEVIEVEEIFEVESIPDGRGAEQPDEVATPNSWQTIKTYIVKEGGRFVEKKCIEYGLRPMPEVKCDGWFHPERFPAGKRLSPEDMESFYTWIPKIDPYQGGDKYKTNLSKIEDVLKFGFGRVALCDHDLVEKLIVKYDGTWEAKRRVGFHRARLEDFWQNRLSPPRKDRFSIFEAEEGDEEEEDGENQSVNGTMAVSSCEL